MGHVRNPLCVVVTLAPVDDLAIGRFPLTPNAPTDFKGSDPLLQSGEAVLRGLCVLRAKSPARVAGPKRFSAPLCALCEKSQV